MRTFIILLSLIGILNAVEVKQKDINRMKIVEITKSGLRYALDKNYAQLMRYSEMSDTCFKELSEKKRDDLETCESYQQITKDIQVRIERLEDLKRRYYSK